MYDVIVVGAGAAGLAAAKTAREAGLRVAVMEAAPRIGGRAYTDHASFGFPFDRGCHWLHSASINPLTELAHSYGFNVFERVWHPRIHDGAGWLDEPHQREALDSCERSFAAVLSAGRAGRDVAASEVIARDGRWSALIDHWFTAINGAEPSDYSTLAYASDVDTNENWPIEEGYGALIARYGADVDVELATPVERIDWAGADVEVRTPRGTLRARALILTVSTGVLADESIRFEPALPAWKRDAVAAFPMGRANKVALLLKRNVLDLPPHAYAISLPSAPETMGFQLRPFGHDVAIGYVAGRYAADLERAGAEAMREAALDNLVSLFGSTVRRAVQAVATTSWERNRWVRGAYSTARPGQALRRADLAAPLGERLFFAGEATSADAFATAHGAYQSGIDAARAVAHQLGGTSGRTRQPPQDC